MSSPNYIHSWMDMPHMDLKKNVLTDKYAQGIQEFMGLAQ